MNPVQDAARILRDHVSALLVKIAEQGVVFKHTYSGNLIALIAIMYSDSLGDLNNIVERWDDFSSDDVRAAGVQQIRVRIEAALFVAQLTTIGPEIPMHSAYIIDCAIGLNKIRNLVIAWNDHAANKDLSPLDRAQSFISTLNVAPTENE